jgi:ribosomal protein S18 acetylase RimI-like enzyme
MTPIIDAAFRPVQIRMCDGRPLLVRAFDFDDFGALVEMYKGFEPKRVAQGLPPPDVPRIAQWLDRLQAKSRSLLALDGKRVVGHVILCPISDASVEYTIFVHQDYRQRGVGMAMTRLALDWVSEMGFAEVFLTTELSNVPALNLYRKFGFQSQSVFGDECEMKVNVVSRSNAVPRAA